ncbi:MAG: hypothetical protein BWY66_00541 [bacterium ADurb.Bin374]|nr:MAG: hypothetical protein BWY66_00541 [bacterium ADurb.Bin374]
MRRLIIVPLMLVLSGCVISRASFKPAVAATATEQAKPPELRVWRGAVLYPFKLSGLEFDTGGMLKLGGYETDGGAAGFCTVLDSSGKFMGTMSATAAKAALAK